MKAKKVLSIISVIVVLVALIVGGTIIFSGNRSIDINEQLILGEKYLEELDYEKAIAAYEAILKVDPQNKEAYMGIVDVYIAQGKYKEAYEYAEKGYGETADAEFVSEMLKIGQETTTEEQEPETTEPTIKPNIYQIFTKVAEDEDYISISLETEKFPEGEYSFYITFSSGNTTYSIMVGNEGQTSGVAYRQTDSGYICTLRKEYVSNIQDVVVSWISIDEGVINTEVVKVTDYDAYVKEQSTSDNVAEGQIIYVWDGTFEKEDKVLLEDKYLYLQDVYKVTSGSRYTNESFEYRKSVGTDGIIITGLVDEKQSKLVIPETIDGKKVVGIEGDIAQFNRYITEVILPDSVIWIGSGAFSLCDNLSSVSFSNNLEWIGEDAFYSSSLKNLELPESLLSIGESAFEQALATEYDGLYEKKLITIPKNVEEIGEAAFCNNENIKGFIVNADNENFIVENEVLYTKNYETLLAVPETLTDSSYYVKEGCQNIGKSAFTFCDNLESVHIPDTVQEIGEQAFYACSKLKEVILPKGLREIKYWTFGYCEALQEIVIPDTVSIIRREAFDGCGMLEKIDIPTGVTHIWKDAFKGTLWLKNKMAENPFVIVNGSLIAIPDDIKGDIAIPAGMTAIGEGVFSWNSNITSVIVPEGVTYIGESAFEGSGTTSISISNGVTEIGDDAFSRCAKLKNIEIPESVTSIGANAFSECNSLESIIIPRSVTSIGESAFYGCALLENIMMPEGVTVIRSSTFSNCDSLQSITIPEGVTSIGDHAFAACDSLENITIPEGVTSIGNHVFTHCDSLKSIILPESVTSIGESAFYGCDLLENIMIPEGVTVIRSLTFDNCVSLKSITIPEGVSSIERDAFYGCASLESITIPKSVTSIGNFAFSNCDSLENITIPEGVTSIGNYAFSDCDSLMSITIPESVTSIEYRTFENSANVVIHCKTGAYAETYAKERGIAYVAE